MVSMTAMMTKVCIMIVNVCSPSPAAQPFSSREMVFDTIVNTLPRYNVRHPGPLKSVKPFASKLPRTPLNFPVPPISVLAIAMPVSLEKGRNGEEGQMARRRSQDTCWGCFEAGRLQSGQGLTPPMLGLGADKATQD